MKPEAGPTPTPPRGGVSLGMVLGVLVGLAAVACATLWWWYLGRVPTLPDGPLDNQPGLKAMMGAKSTLAAALQASDSGAAEVAAAKAREAAALADETLAAVGPMHPFGLNARCVKGAAQRLTGDADGAVKTLETLMADIPMKPGTADFHPEILVQAQTHWGLALAVGKKHRPAIEALRASENIKGAQDAVGNDARFAQAGIHESAGEYDQALAVYRRIIDEHPGPEKGWAHQAGVRTTLLKKNLPPAKPKVGKAAKVSGTLDGKTTWTKAGGPYQVEGAVRVPAGATLEIGPGTDVYFAEGASLTVAGSLTVSGGAGDERVLFTSLADRLGSFAWEGVTLAAEDGKAKSVAAGWRIESARVGLTVRTSAVELRGTTVSGSGQAGVVVEGGVGPSFEDCVVEKSLWAGVEAVRSAAPSFRKCRLTANRGPGLSASERAAPELTDCEVADNGREGLLLVRSAAGKVVGGRVQSNGGVGVKLDQRCKPEIRGVEISANGEAGVACNDSSPTLTGLTVADNRGPGVVLTGQAGGRIADGVIRGNGGPGLSVEVVAGIPEIRGNRITGHDVGIRVRSGGGLKLAGNDLSGNRKLALSNETGNRVNAGGNFWGPTSEEQVAALVKGTVDVKPVLAAPPGGAATQEPPSRN